MIGGSLFRGGHTSSGLFRQTVTVDLTPEQRRTVGTTIKRARLAAGHRTLPSLHQATGISTKTLGATEAGMRVSDETLWTIEAALGWPSGRVEEIANGLAVAFATGPARLVATAGTATAYTGSEILRGIGDDELVAELGRRLQAARVTEVAPVGDELAGRRRPAEPPLDAAADSRENRGAQLRDELDVLGEGSQDDAEEEGH